MRILSVVIPVFNEENTISKILSLVAKRPEVKEIIVVDDGSTDRTYKILSRLKRKKTIQIVRHNRNQGKGAAIISGINNACSPYLIIQDADLEYTPNDYPKLLQALQTNKADFVFGNRWSSKRGYLAAQIGNYYMNVLTNALFGCHYQDSYTGYKIGLTKVWKRLALRSKGFEIEAEISAKLAKEGFSVFEVPIRYIPRTYQEGKKIGVSDVIKGTITLLKMKSSCCQFRKP